MHCVFNSQINLKYITKSETENFLRQPGNLFKTSEPKWNLINPAWEKRISFSDENNEKLNRKFHCRRNSNWFSLLFDFLKNSSFFGIREFESIPFSNEIKQEFEAQPMFQREYLLSFWTLKVKEPLELCVNEGKFSSLNFYTEQTFEPILATEIKKVRDERTDGTRHHLDPKNKSFRSNTNTFSKNLEKKLSWNW